MNKMILVLVSLCIGIMFQNCSDMKFVDSKNVASKLGTDTNQTQVVPNTGSTPDSAVPTPTVNPTDPTNPSVSPPLANGTVQPPNSSTDSQNPTTDQDDDDYHAHDLKDTCKDFSPPDIYTNPLPASTTDESVQNVRNSIHISTALRSLRTNNVRGTVSVDFASTLTQVNNQRGDLCVAFASGGIINNTRGNIIFVGVSDSHNSRAKLNIIHNHRGIIHLKNIDVELASDIRGTLILENSTIKESKNVDKIVEY